MNSKMTIPLQLVLVLSTAIIITARPNIPQYERIRKYRYSVGEGSTSETSQEPLLSSATIKTTTSMMLSTTTTSTNSNNYHHKRQQLYKFSTSSSGTNHISFHDFIHLTSLEASTETQLDNDPKPSSCSYVDPGHIHDESSGNTSMQSHDHMNDNYHTHHTNKLHRTYLRIPTRISATKVILESEEFNEDHLFESYIYS